MSAYYVPFNPICSVNKIDYVEKITSQRKHTNEEQTDHKCKQCMLNAK